MASVAKLAQDRLYASVLSDSLVLITCQRIEIVSPKPLDEQLWMDAVGHAPMIHEGIEPILRRLVEIACGMRSQVLGERSIFHQLHQDVHRMLAETPVYRLVMRALAIAAEVRLVYGFYAVNDYEETVFQLLSNDSGVLRGNRPRTFVTIGGGMLGRAVVVAASRYGFERVILLTRSTRKVRKYYFENIDIAKSDVDASELRKVEVTSLSCFPYDIIHQGYCTFIATSSITEAYKQKMFDIVSHPNNCGAVDFCSIPLFDSIADPSAYVTLYDKRYLHQVSLNNQRLAPLVSVMALHLNSVIESTCYEVART